VVPWTVTTLYLGQRHGELRRWYMDANLALPLGLAGEDSVRCCNASPEPGASVYRQLLLLAIVKGKLLTRVAFF
jgi:hypothetical protein